MLSLGPYQHLPENLASNPFHALIVRFSRYKTGSFELLFTAEMFLLRYSGLGLLVMFALVLPRLEEIDGVRTLVRMSTLVYPCLFLWSLTRLSGVELMQMILEGRWTGEILAAPLSNQDLINGFVAPIQLIIRQYVLITLFSLALYAMERHFVVVLNEEIYIGDLLKHTIFYWSLFYNAAAWIIFVYLGRLFAEVRLRNGLLKGLATLVLLAGGVGIFAGYCLLFIRYPHRVTDARVLAGILILSTGLILCAVFIHWRLARHFRGYLSGQLDLDLLVYDQTDPRVSAWQVLDPGFQAEEKTGGSAGPHRLGPIHLPRI